MSAPLAKALRRLLGRRGTWAIGNAVAAVATWLGLVSSRREGRPRGVSATVITYDDPDWLWLSLRAASEVAEEVLVIDSSDPWDETLEVLERAREELGVKVYRQYPPRGYAEARREALRRSTYSWILVWDSDFIPFEGFRRAFRDALEGLLDDRGYYMLYWPWVTLCGDLSHRCRADRYHVEHWAFTYSSRLRYDWDGRFEYLRAPPYYFRRWLSREPQGLHLTGVRRPERLALKELSRRVNFYEVASSKGMEEAMKLVRREAARLYGTEDLREVGLRIMREMARGRPPFDVGLIPREVLDRAKEIGVPVTA
mgnify:CR=1 FL=1